MGGFPVACPSMFAFELPSPPPSPRSSRFIFKLKHVSLTLFDGEKESMKQQQSNECNEAHMI